MSCIDVEFSSVAFILGASVCQILLAAAAAA